MSLVTGTGPETQLSAKQMFPKLINGKKIVTWGVISPENVHVSRGLLGHTSWFFILEISRPLWQAARECGEHSPPPPPRLVSALAGLALTWLTPPGGEDKPSPPPFPGKMGHFWLWASLTRGHLILAGFVLFILVNRAVYFQFVFLGMSAHFASLLFTLCKHLGLSKYAYKVPGTGLFCVWYFNGL